MKKWFNRLASLSVTPFVIVSFSLLLIWTLVARIWSGFGFAFRNWVHDDWHDAGRAMAALGKNIRNGTGLSFRQWRKK